MGKFWGLLLIGALALTACSAPADTAAPAPAPVPPTSATATITAAPIAPKVAAKTAPTGPSVIGDPTADAAFLSKIKESWRGEAPADGELLSAAKFACDELAAGKQWNEIRPVQGTTDDEVENSLSITAWAGRTYCTAYNPDRP
jgi:Protein of unknown function (DUF732)